MTPGLHRGLSGPDSIADVFHTGLRNLAGHPYFRAPYPEGASKTVRDEANPVLSEELALRRVGNRQPRREGNTSPAHANGGPSPSFVLTLIGSSRNPLCITRQWLFL